MPVLFLIGMQQKTQRSSEELFTTEIEMLCKMATLSMGKRVCIYDDDLRAYKRGLILFHAEPLFCRCQRLAKLHIM